MNTYVASHLKDMNRQVVYNLIAEKGTTSKAEITKLTGISSPTVIKIVNFLIEKQLVLELGEGESAIGRKPHLLTINKKLMYGAAFFLEGDFLTMGIVDIGGQVLYKRQLRIEPRFQVIMERISSGLVEGLFAEAGLALGSLLGIGIAIPGIYDEQKRIIKTAPLIGVDTPASIGESVDSLSQKYGVPVKVENDTNCQCFGEFRRGRYGENEDLIFISVGTGLGAGVILNGNLRRGAHSMCGEIGYISFLDDYVSDTKNAGWLESRIGYRVLEKKFGLTSDLSAMPPAALESVTEYVAIPVALCVNNIMMFLDGRNVTVGGIVVNLLGDRLIEAINRRLRYLCLGEIRVQKQSCEDIGLIGISAMLTEEKILAILTEEG